MGKNANRLHQSPETVIAYSAKVPVSPPRETPAASRMVPFDLKPLIAPYRGRGRFSLRIENLPQSARLSAGHNNGDRTWSLGLDELEGLSYLPPPCSSEEHTLALRLISKDEAHASTIALIDVVVKRPDDRNGPLTLQLPRVVATNEVTANESSEAPQHLRQQIQRLKTLLSEREAHINELQGSVVQSDTDWRLKFDAKLSEAENAWKTDEAVRIAAARLEVQDQFQRLLTESERDAKTSGELATAALGQLRQNLALAEDRLARREAELAQLEATLARVEQEVEVRSIRQASESATVVETGRYADVVKALADATSRCEAAETTLAAVGEVGASTKAENLRLRAQIDLLRTEMDAQVSAARTSAEREAEDRLMTAQVLREQRTATALADATSRCEAAETALAAIGEVGASTKAENLRLQTQIDLLRAEMDAKVSAARTSAEREVEDWLMTARTLREQSTATALTDLTSRYEAAETALAAVGEVGPSTNAEYLRLQTQIDLMRAEMDAKVSAARASAERQAEERLMTAQALWQQKADKALAEVATHNKMAGAALAADARSDDAYVSGLNREIKRLQAVLVDREVSTARAQAQLEQVRIGAVPDTPGTRWRPLSNRPSPEGDRTADKGKSHLVRDVVAVFVVVIIAVVLFPQIEIMLPDSIQSQIASFSGSVEHTSDKTTPLPTTHTAGQNPAQLIALVVRSVNIRAEPSASATLVASLKLGAQVQIIEKHGKWNRVAVAGVGKITQQGWVYGSYLQEAGIHSNKP